MVDMAQVPLLSHPVFIPKPCTHRMHDPGSIVPHIRSKVFADNQMSRIKYDYYYINSVSKDYDDSQWNKTAEDSKTPQERRPRKHSLELLIKEFQSILSF
jgi:hypothetical protein